MAKDVRIDIRPLYCVVVHHIQDHLNTVLVKPALLHSSAK
jgi:hypothetical protein